MKRILKSGVFLSALLLIAGCAKAPQEAIESATVMIEDAQMQEADVFAPELFAAAQDSFNAAQTEIETQNGKFALTRNYDAAAARLASATELARQASEAGVVRKQEMRVETENLLAQARETAEQAKLLMTQAPRGKEGRIALVAIGADVDSLGGMFTEVEELLAQGNVKAANERVNVALQRAQGLTQELQDAIDKTKGRGRG